MEWKKEGRWKIAHKGKLFQQKKASNWHGSTGIAIKKKMMENQLNKYRQILFKIDGLVAQ